MNAVTRHRLLVFVYVGLVFALSACSKLVLSTNYTLDSGQEINGDLWVLSGNVKLQPGSRVTGSVFQICCNLDANGRVNNNIFLLTGNLRLGSDANVRGGAVVFSGNLQRLPGSELGETSPDAGERLLIGFVGLFCILPLAIIILLTLLVIVLLRGRAQH